MDNYIILGLPRNGSQAIIQWIRSQIKDVNYYHNLEMFFEAESDGNNLIRREAINLLEDNNLEIENAKTISMLRNPWNVIASHAQWKVRANGPLYLRKISATKKWLQYYEEYVNTESKIYFIIYDKWFTDIEYRKKISNDLGLEFSDEKFEHVPRSGGGSSFDRKSTRNECA